MTFRFAIERKLLSCPVPQPHSLKLPPEPGAEAEPESEGDLEPAAEPEDGSQKTA